MELNEKSLVKLCGWPVFERARAIHRAGRVTDATFSDGLLKGRVTGDDKSFLAGLRMRNPIDIENLCPCRDSRQRGIVCAHSIAVGLQVLAPTSHRESNPPTPTRPPSTISPTPGEVPRVRLTLEGSLRHVDATVEFDYSSAGGTNPAAEAHILARFLEMGFVEFRGAPALKGEAAILKFYATQLPTLRDEWTVIEGERFKRVTSDLVRIEPQFAIRESKDGWLDLHIHHTAGSDAVFSHSDFQRLLQSGNPHIQLKSGKIAIADPSFLSDLEETLRDCDGHQEGGKFRIPDLQKGYLNGSIARWTGRDHGSNSTGTNASDLGPLKMLLRPYQILGATWLLDRALAGTGGLLADEMGLGKTVQSLAMCQALDQWPVLIICPSSLVWNWCREIEKFLPNARMIAHHGSDRHTRTPELAAAQFVITSYAVLRRDIDSLRNTEFAATILDEAQHIKNPDSQNARATRRLRSRSRFILTGTPVENAIRDLWSLFEFLLPGYLGHRKDFQERYENPLSSGVAGATWARLNRRLAPWILRRRKADLLPELPPKIEQIVEVELTDKQKSAYSGLQRAARDRLDALADSNSGTGRMQVFTALLRLRQACCDLRLLGAPGTDPSEQSAKLAVLLDLLDDAQSGGHRALVFSQFTSMLDLIEPALAERNIPFVRLDGSTRDRGSVVERFESDPRITAFLISLKAGGVGLNLTSADLVIHFDPWWNPAVEAQATDRAHRIGQTRVVTSIKLIARNTVEERVIRLQEKKKTLLAGAIDSAPESLESLDTNELLDLISPAIDE